MIKCYTNDTDIGISDHFKLSEFKCKCGKCNVTFLDTRLVEKLQILRNFVKVPIYITSGYRCNEHNAKVGGVPNSYHTQGSACDMYCFYPVPELLDLCRKIGFTFIKHYPNRNFVHLDIRSIV